MERQQAMLPPFTYQALVRADANSPLYPQSFLNEVANHIQQFCMLAGPMPAPMEKRAGKYRFHLMLQSKTRAGLHQALAQLLLCAEQIEVAKRVRWTIDIDPQDLTW